jgi:UDP-N-acetylglucosamine--N-acetylmuramyl-(pentapeptide) pyrophosphoryl-undecaprenol N-acetylglucosamine transferase
VLLIATGGYVCFPIVIATRLLCALGLLRCRIALLEINVQPGLTNRLVAPLVDEVWTTYAASERFFRGKAVLTGTPVRAGIARGRAPATARTALGLAVDRPTIVVIGGSQGARTINEAVATLVREQAPVAGNLVRLVPYLDDPADAYSAADIVVARAGASTLAELAVTGTPAILVPYPFAADGHQAANAAVFAAAGAAVVVADADFSAEALLATLRTTLAADRLGAMRAAAAALAPSGATAKIVERITALLAPRVGDSASPKPIARD